MSPGADAVGAEELGAASALPGFIRVRRGAQIRDAREIAPVPREQNQIMVSGGRGDEKIEIGNEHAGAAQAGASATEDLHDGIGEGQRSEPIQQDSHLMEP
jgi:hypothetical protein